MVDLLNAFHKTVKKYNMFDGAKKIGVAFSGGSDSSALLHLLYSYCKDNNLSLEAIHINHSIRGENAKRDEDFCIKICKKFGIYLTHLTFDIPLLAKEWGMGEEEAGRTVRYASFDKIMLERDIDYVCTAHHANDNAETVVFNMTRGAGLRGLSGIPPVRGKIVRPLIECTKEQINRFISQNNIPFVDDETNEEDEYSRNFIRHNIIPDLNKLNQNAVANISKAASLLREDDEYIFSVAEWYKDASVTILKNLPNPVLSRVLMLISGDKHVNLGTSIEAVRNAIPTRVSVGSGLMLVIKDDRLFFIADERENKKREFSYSLNEGITDICETDYLIYIGEKKYTGNYDIYHEICVNPNGSLVARSRLEGDKLFWHGMNRPIKNLFQQCDIPSYERNGKIFICDDDGIIWIPGVAKKDNIQNGKIYIQLLRKGSNEND